MPVSDSLAVLAGELQAMPPRARRAILRALTGVERQALETYLEEGPVADARPVETSGGFSPWLSARIGVARGEAGAGPSADRMTQATRQVLLRSVDAINGTARSPAKGPDNSGRSLFDAVNGMLSPRRMRS